MFLISQCSIPFIEIGLCGVSSCNVITKEVLTLPVENVTFPVENVTFSVVQRPKRAYKYLLITLIVLVCVLVLCI